MTDNIDNNQIPNPEPTGPEGIPIQPVELDKDARMWAMFCHLSGLLGIIFPVIGNIVAPLVIWQLNKEKPFVDDQGKEAVNFQISLSIYGLIGFFLTVSVILLCIGIPLLAAVYIFFIVFVIIATIKSNDGYRFRYPLTIRFIK